MQRMIYRYLTGVAFYLFISACTPNPAIQPTHPIVTQPDPLPVTTPTIPPQPTPEALVVYPPAVWAAIEDLALHLMINPDQVKVISFLKEEWPDSCLGLAAADEMCLQVITPGYRVLLGASGQRFEYHTDQSGGALRVIGDTVLDPIKPGVDLDKPQAILAAMQALNLATGITINEIQVTSIEAAQWSDSCLGLARSDEMCAEVITPGWKIILNTADNIYIFHTDQSGENLRQR